MKEIIRGGYRKKIKQQLQIRGAINQKVKNGLGETLMNEKLPKCSHV